MPRPGPWSNGGTQLTGDDVLKGLVRRFVRGPASQVPVEPPARIAVDMRWRLDTRLPIPDWERLREPAGDDDQRHRFWTSAAGHWLDALGATFGAQYRVRESGDFLLLSALPERSATLFLRFCERALAQVRRNLGELASDDGWGKYVAIVVASHDDYYEYVSHYQPDGGEYAMSSGMFIHAGYGHFALPEDGLGEMEPVIAHELTHAELAHLPIPAWLNEGLAVNTEHAMFPMLADPRAQLLSPRELQAQHAAYWNHDSIQAFWSGKSFLVADDGNRLSYDLAKTITALAARDERAFRAFVATARMEDAGTGAEQALGYPLAHLVEAVLGEGDWAPRPHAWREGIEGGWFRGRGAIVAMR